MPSTSAKQAKFMRAVAHSPKFAKKVGVPQSVGKDYEMADKKAKKFGDGGTAKKAKPPMPREPITGGPDTVPLTPERKKFLAELERRNKQAKEDAAKTAKKATPYAKGGDVKGRVAAVRPKVDEMMAKAKSDIESMKANAARFAPKAGAKPAAPRPQGDVRKPMGQGQALRERMMAINPGKPATRPQPVPSPAVMPTPTNKPPLPGMKKGGKVMKKATKYGAAMTKKSADTMGRAMVKKNKGGSCYASGGLVAGHKSADGIAKKGKTKGKMC